jgi:hypothetical protein
MKRVALLLLVIGVVVGAVVWLTLDEAPDEATKLRDITAQASAESVDVEVLHCASRFARILEARDRYLAWAPESGPTCAERHIQGTFAAHDDTEAACLKGAGAAEQSWPEAAPALRSMAAVGARAGEPLRRAAAYYGGRAFDADGCALGVELHPVLTQIFQDATRGMGALAPLLDARLRTAVFVPAFEGKRGAALRGYYAALGALAAEAPTSKTASWSSGRLLDAWDRVKEAHAAVEAAPRPQLPAEIGLWRGSTENAQAAQQSLERAVARLKRPAHELRPGWDPSGIRAAVYRALVVGLRIPVP